MASVVRARRVHAAVVLAFAMFVSTLPARPATAVGPLWGLMSGYGGIDLDDMYARGVRVAMVEMNWRRAEPSNGAFDESYFSSVRRRAAALRNKGFKVVLNFGLHHAPDWLLAKPGARFVNQHGHVYKASDEPNLIFGTKLRGYGKRYIAKVFSELGTRFYAVRVGGGHWGELQYPQVFNSTTGKLKNYYWAFDANAKARNPVPGWKPGMAAPNKEDWKFLTWYFWSLTRYQNWQVKTVRRYYPGYIAVLYASWGLRRGDITKALDTNLSGTSSPEINGEVQRGYHHRRHIKWLPDDPKVVAWGTWAERQGTISWLSYWARKKGIGVMGENSGQDDLAKMKYAVYAAKKYRLKMFIWVRAEFAYCRCNGWATIDDYERLIA